MTKLKDGEKQQTQPATQPVRSKLQRLGFCLFDFINLMTLPE